MNASRTPGRSTKRAPKPQPPLADPIRALLAGEGDLREVSMFGGLSFMVNGKMVVSAFRNGDLLVRVAAEQHDELIARPGARQAEMGAGRTMGPGWVWVSSDALQDVDRLAFWIDLGLAHNRAAAGS